MIFFNITFFSHEASLRSTAGEITLSSPASSGSMLYSLIIFTQDKCFRVPVQTLSAPVGLCEQKLLWLRALQSALQSTHHTSSDKEQKSFRTVWRKSHQPPSSRLRPPLQCRASLTNAITLLIKTFHSSALNPTRQM